MSLLIDLTHTSHTRARTGIQRVTRSLHAALRARGDGLAVCYDHYEKTWRVLESWEMETISAAGAAAPARGARWPLRVRLRGFLRRRLGRSSPRLPAATGLVVPEIFSPPVAAALPEIFSQVQGPRIALFHDAVALKLPELTPAKTVARFPSYLRKLLAFDGIAAISEDSRTALIDYWRWIGASDVPPVQTLSLGIDLPSSNFQLSTLNSQLPVLLCVGSVEGRKNHLALLTACEQLWKCGLRFELRLIGLSHPQTGRAALEKITALQQAGRPLRYDGPVDDATVSAAYRECTFTVYPSLMEGFGLPILESLAYGKPCVCSSQGALGQAARGGGCVTIDSAEAAPLAAAIERLLQNPAELAALAVAARARTFKSWDNYATELVSWMQTLPRRN
ncbi:MAG: glycosyltransferase [Verrucomicrobiota bacterium]|nr:glycosyltransferase [Verrucomicrobiota bacterium]